MSVNISGLTSFALLSAIEQDARNLIASISDGSSASEVLGKDLVQSAIERRTKDRRGPATTSTNLPSLLQFIDFGDAYFALRRIDAKLAPETKEALARLGPEWEALIAVRNRVAHSRPLEIDDLPRLVDFSAALTAVPGFGANEANHGTEDYLRRRLTEFEIRLRERRHVADSGHLNRRVGVVKGIKIDKGFAFVHDGDASYFLHASELRQRSYFDTMPAGATVAFEAGLSNSGKQPPALNANWIF